MSASSDLQAAVVTMLSNDGAMRVVVPVVAERTKDLGAEIEAAVANAGLCIYVRPPLPTRAEPDVPFVFFSEAELRVRIVEQPALNATGADAYDLVDDVANALQWQPRAPGPLSPILAYPLTLAQRPAELIDDPAARIIEVIFKAIYGFQPPA